MIAVIIFGVISYIIGSLSSAIIVCQFLGLPDPRKQGSMNPGTTNVLRIGGKSAAFITLVGDILKGFIPVLIGHLIGISGIGLGVIALAAFLGHLFPIFFKFQGGKGVATSFGAILALSPIVGLVLAVIWIVVATISRYSSLAALIASVSAPILMLIFSNSAYFLPLLLMTALLFWKHKNNIHRLRTRTEGKISF